MNDLDFSFEPSPWEAYLQALGPGDRVSAVKLLSMLEGEEEQTFEDALLDLEEGNLILDLSGMPKAPCTGQAATRLRQEETLVKEGLDPKSLEANDPLRLYLEEVAQISASGDEAALAGRAAAGDERAMAALTELGLHRVIDLAREHVGYGVLLLDLIQEGSLGLWKAVCSFRSGDYGAYRDRWIRFYMAKAVTLHARASGVGQKMRTAMEDYQAVDERLLGELGRNPTLEEIALELHMSPEEAAAVKKTLEDARLLARAEAPAEPAEEKEAEQQAVEDTAYFQMRQRILDLLSSLSESDAKLLTLRFGLEGGLPLSPEDTGRRMGLTPQEVVAREAAALAKLRTGE